MYATNQAKQNAKNLRKNLTPEEKHLWYDYLQSYQPKFYKQRPFMNYILDFYCHQAKLAIEIDGAQHYETENRAYDEARTAELAKLGICVLRFTNGDIKRKFAEVCAYIDMQVKEKLQKGK